MMWFFKSKLKLKNFSTNKFVSFLQFCAIFSIKFFDFSVKNRAWEKIGQNENIFTGVLGVDINLSEMIDSFQKMNY